MENDSSSVFRIFKEESAFNVESEGQMAANKLHEPYGSMYFPTAWIPKPDGIHQ